jgi:hypothetical protein
MTNNMDGTYTANLSEPITFSGTEDPQLIGLLILSAGTGWHQMVLDSGNGSAVWQLSEGSADTDCTNWIWSDSPDINAPTPNYPQAGTVA